MLKLSLAIFTMEIRTLLSYRMSFWFKLFGKAFFAMALTYYLWKNLWLNQGTATIAGFKFNEIVLYSFVAPLVSEIIQGIGSRMASQEIYDGGLTKYLIYPVSFLHFKIITHFANSFIIFFQSIFAMVMLWILFKVNFFLSLNLSNTLPFLISLISSSLLYLLIEITIEYAAFWADNVWSLSLLNFFCLQLLGGFMIPLSFFPTWSQNILYYLPYSHLISDPTLLIMGKMTWHEWFAGMIITWTWILLMFGVNRYVWNKGTLEYTGVGI